MQMDAAPGRGAPADAIDLAALEAWLTGAIDGFSGPVRLTKFPGGQSNPTYQLEAGSGTYVLRRKPFGPVLPSTANTA